MSAQTDWGTGQYEIFAPALVPAAEQLVALAAPQPGERAIDLGCGSGNATLPLLETGAVVTAVEPSLRLLGVAAERAAAAGHELATVQAGAERLPLPDGDAALIVSNFALIFCPEPEAAFGELVRVLRPGGRALYTAWLPVGPISEVAQRMRAVIADRQDDGSGSDGPASAFAHRAPDPAGVLWHDPSTFAHLIPGGADAISTHEGEAVFAAVSAEAWFSDMERHHPAWLAARSAMSEADWATVRREGIEVLEQPVTADGTLAIRSPYVVVELRPQD